MSGGRKCRREVSARWFGNSATLTQISQPFRDARVDPDALVWAAGRQPGDRLLRDNRLLDWQPLIIHVFGPMPTPLVGDNS